MVLITKDLDTKNGIKKLIVKRWNSNGVYHQRFRPKNEIKEIDHLNVVIKCKYHLLLFHSSPFSDSSGYTTMFQIDDLDDEIKRIDHLSTMEIRKIMHINIDSMGPCIIFITVSFEVSKDNNINLETFDYRYLIIYQSSLVVLSNQSTQ